VEVIRRLERSTVEKMFSPKSRIHPDLIRFISKKVTNGINTRLAK
jgi:hypothetical protein